MSDNNSNAFLQNSLQVLVGLPLGIVRDAADMKIFHFGAIHPHPSGRGTVGEYALHVQCPWRIVNGEAIVTGYLDRFTEPEDGVETDDGNYLSGNLQRVRIAGLLKGYDSMTGSTVNATGQLIVISVASDRYGGADLSLTGGYRLQIFPDGSAGENWRFIEREGRHIVIGDGRAPQERDIT